MPSPKENEKLLIKFYRAFAKKDAETMADCYANDVVFDDPVFPHLSGRNAKDMWRMLCSRSLDLRVTFKNVRATKDSGSVHWEATYTFNKTDRKVHNVVEASFELKNGRIVKHKDAFSFWRWSRQAFGPVGWFLGWSAYLQGKIQREAAKSLDKFSTESSSR